MRGRRWTPTEEEVREIVARFERGETSLRAERRRFGLSSGVPVRKVLAKHVGGERCRELLDVRDRSSAQARAAVFTEGSVVTLEIGPKCVLHAQRVGDRIVLRSAYRVSRYALKEFGFVALPLDKLPDVIDTLRRVAASG
jgi:hypothetical protein